MTLERRVGRPRRKKNNLVVRRKLTVQGGFSESVDS